MTRAKYRFRNFRIEADEEPDAEPHTFGMECVACGSSGPAKESPERATAWAWAHLREVPEHLTYREWISRPYRVVPGDWQ